MPKLQQDRQQDLRGIWRVTLAVAALLLVIVVLFLIARRHPYINTTLPATLLVAPLDQLIGAIRH